MKTLLCHKNQAVATVSLNRPDVHNAFNEELMDELYQTFLELNNDPNTRVILLTGEGKSFCAGADLNYMKAASQKTQEQNKDEAVVMERMFRLIDECPKPVIGLVHGSVFGGGVGLVSVCDVVLVHTEVKFCLSEVKLGLNPSVISPFVMHKIGAAQARRFFLTAEVFNAQQALHMNLVHEIFETTEQKEILLNHFLTHFLKNGPTALQEAKNLIQKNLHLAESELHQFTTNQLARLRVSTEAQEGMNAFFAKRDASYVIKNSPQ